MPENSNGEGRPRTMFQDDSGNTSSGRVMCFIALIVGSIALLAGAFGLTPCGTDYNTTLAFLFAGALGGKAAQKKWEK